MLNFETWAGKRKKKEEEEEELTVRFLPQTGSSLYGHASLHVNPYKHTMDTTPLPPPPPPPPPLLNL
jgi:hypothetical protein